MARSRTQSLPAVVCALALTLVLVGCGSGARPSRPSGTSVATSATTTGATRATGGAPGRRLVLRASQTGWRLPAPVYRTVAAAAGGRIFVFGGHDAAGATIRRVDELDVATGAARIAGTLAVATHGAAAAALGVRMVVFGGASTTVHDVVQQFDPRPGSTRVIARLPGPRADVTAAVIGHTVVLVGGFDGIGPQRDVWASADGRHFHVIAKLPQAVRYPAVVAQGDCAYVFGGLISGDEYNGRFSDLIQRVCVGHPAAAVVVGRLATPLAHAMGALVAGRVLVLGGSTPHGPSAAILRFEPATGRVLRAGRLPYPLTDAAVATVHDTAYLLGGISARPLASVIEVRLADPGPAHGRQCGVRAVLGGRTHVASGAVALATGYGSVWVSGFGAVSRLQPVGGRVVARIRTPATGDYSQLAVGDRSVWVTSTARGVVYRIDPSTNRVIATVHVGGPVQGIAVGSGRVWVTLPLQGPGQLIAIDPRDDRVTGQPIEVGPGPGQVVYGLQAVWVQNTSPSSVMRADPTSRRATTVIGTAPVAPGSPVAGAIAVGHGSLWSAANGSLTRVGPVLGRVRSGVPIPRGVALALGSDRVWVLAYPRSSSPGLFYPIKGTAALWEIDPASGRVAGSPVLLGAKQPIAIAAGPHALWIANYNSSMVTRMRLLVRPGQNRRGCRGSR
ncbi:MAG: hypothetical protein ACR2NR_05445 [Solirubrobacteraceae bacterium]